MKITNFIVLLFLPVLAFAQNVNFRLLEEPSIDSFPKVTVKFNLRNPEIIPKEAFRVKEDSLLDFNYELLESSEIPETKNVLIIFENLRFQNRNRFYKEVLKNSIPKITGKSDNFNIGTFDRVHNNTPPQILFYDDDKYTDNFDQLLDRAVNIPDLPKRSGYNNTLSYNQKDVNVESSDLYFAIYSGLQKLNSDFPGGNNYLVVLSTAFNNKNSSHVSTQTAMEFAKSKNIPVYSVQYKIQGYEGHRLTELCTETYGEEIISNDVTEVSASLAGFMQNALKKSQGINYEFSYYSSFPKDGKIHNANILIGSDTYNFNYYTPKENIIQRLWNTNKILFFLGALLLTLLVLFIIILVILSVKKKYRLQKELILTQSSADEAAKKAEQQQSELQRIKNAENARIYKQEQEKLLQEFLIEMKSKGTMPQLFYQINGISGEFKMEKPLIKIGRTKSNDLVLDFPTVSREHAEFYFSGGAYFIRDLKSTSGTLVNGKKVESEILKQGDHINIGGVEIYFKL
jgi:hypothetical protein